MNKETILSEPVRAGSLPPETRVFSYNQVLAYLDQKRKGGSMKEFDNYLSQFYGNGSAAENLPASKRVYTEAEMQRALSMALLQNGIRKHLDIQDCLNTDVINDTCLDTKNQETEKNLHPVVPGRDDLRFNSEGFLSSEGKQLVRNKKGELCRPE